ncbi:MAG: 4-hydroxy-tetrahydrodipicolinate reductase [Pseudomonadota bacterium]|nr:4-hydroxy-tetrahydrodipicolinate reductase [Pseudomonadota bacterium]
MKIGVVGSAGRMGRALVREVEKSEGVKLAAAIENTDHASVGNDAGLIAGIGRVGVQIGHSAEELFSEVDCVIEFSSPGSTVAHAAHAAKRQITHIIGTTGLDEDQEAALVRAATKTQVFWAPNMSMGVNVLLALVEKAAAALDEDFDAEVLEMHHRRKVDAPSGTALALGRAVAQGRGVELNKVGRRTRDGITGERPRGEIGFAVLRGGDVVGDHRVIYASDNETVELTHSASSRQIFAAGAVRAALWLQDKPPGLYGMKDLLGLHDIS